MWEAWNIHHHRGRDQHWTTIKRSNVRKQKLVSTPIPSYVLVAWKRPSWRSQDVFIISRCCGNRWRSNWVRVEHFTRISDIVYFQEIQKDFEKKNIQPENFSYRIIFMSMLNDILSKTDDENCISNAKKVNPELEKRWYRDSRSTTAVGSHSQQNGTAIQRHWSFYLHKYQWPLWNLKQWKCWYLLRTWHLEKRCKEARACGSLKEQEN